MEYKIKYLEIMEKYDTLNAKLNVSSTNVHITQLNEQLNDQTSPNRQIGHGNVPIVTPYAPNDSLYVPDAFVAWASWYSK